MGILTGLIGGVIGLLWATPALAHAGEVHWSFEPWIGVPLMVSGLLYLGGLRRLAFRRISGGRAWLFAAGWLLLVLPVATPLHPWGEQSFAAHMVEHEIIMVLAAPLLALSRPLGILLWGLPGRVRDGLVRAGRNRGVRRIWRGLTSPFTATSIQSAVLWLWHAPRAFEAALASPVLHAAQHASFLASAVLFWWSITRSRRLYGAGVLCQFLTMLQTGLLGALILFAPNPLYARYPVLEDQQLAGLIMWVPAGMVHAGAALVLIALLLRNSALEGRLGNGRYGAAAFEPGHEVVHHELTHGVARVDRA